MKPEQMELINRGRAADLIPVLQADNAEHPGDSNLMHDLALVYAQSNRHLDAVRLYENIIRANPRDGGALASLGYCYNRVGDQVRAWECLDSVVRDQGVHVDSSATVQSLAWTNMGAISEENVFFEKAYDCYAQALVLYPQNHMSQKYIRGLQDLADPDDGPIGVRTLADGKQQTYVWDGSYIASRYRPGG